jgi:hypothetical protein
LLCAATAGMLCAGAASANAAHADTALGIPCVPGPGGVRLCEGTLANRVPTWDGVPLDVTVTLPPAAQAGPYPLIVGLHGFGTAKQAGFGNPPTDYLRYAQEGYATLEYSARGIALSCGVIASRTSGCEKGWIHLADARYEVRDTQYLAGLLADEGWVRPKRIGVTGVSYGGGQSLLLATLRDRIMLPDGSFAPWRSPKGKAMRIAAAAPQIGWSDLAYALVPSGRTLDFRANNPYGPGFGVVKYSYLTGLYAAEIPGFYAPPGADPDADITNWKNAIDAGEPYDPAFVRHVKGIFKRYHSAYYLQDTLPPDRREAPAPVVIYNGFNDDIMPVDEALRYYNLVRNRFPGASIGLVFEATFAHNRGSLTAIPEIANAQRDILFARYLKGDVKAKPLRGVITTTIGCNDVPALGPFRTSSWAAQHPGEVRLRSIAPQTFTSAGGSAANGVLTDPFFGGPCPGTSAMPDPGAATYQTDPARGGGYTLIGAPTIRARVDVTGPYSQIDGRLWDVSPDGHQTMVTHGSYKPDPHGMQVFQLHPSAWHFARGHSVKLELLGRDYPYAQPSKGNFSVTVGQLRLDVPVREDPDGGQISPYNPPRSNIGTPRVTQLGG